MNDMKLLLINEPLHGGLIAYDDESAAYISRIKDDEIIIADVRRGRNVRQHRLFWVLVGLLHEQQTIYTTKEQLAAAIKVGVGWCDFVSMPKGSTVAIPKSIAFDKMDQFEFDQFFESVIRFVCAHIIPGLDKSNIRNEVERIVGIAPDQLAWQRHN